jgi:hypothetical protein
MPVSAHERRWKVLAVLCVAVFLVVDNTVVNVALHTRTRPARLELGAAQRSMAAAQATVAHLPGPWRADHAPK